jgi:hypothetical protein
METSKFEKLSDEQLNKYMAYFNKIVTNRFSDMDDFYREVIYDDELPKKIGIPIGISQVERLDLEYLFYLIDNNPDGGPYTNRPRLESKAVDYVTEERVRIRYTRTGDILTYAIGAVDENYLNTLKSEDQIDPWEWDMTDKDERDGDIIDDWFEA